MTPKTTDMNNDILESEEFTRLMDDITVCRLQDEPLHIKKLKDFIRSNFTQNDNIHVGGVKDFSCARGLDTGDRCAVQCDDCKSTKQSVHCVFYSGNRYGIGDRSILPKEYIVFRGNYSECLAEKSRLESVGQDNIEKEEIGKMKCLCGQKTVAQCDLGDCQFPKPKPPYTREEFLTVATAAMNGMLANSIDVNQGSQPRWQLGSVDLAKDACEYADSLLSEVNKRFEK